MNEKLIVSHIGEDIEKADADFVRNITGFVIGGIPPIGHKEKIYHIFVDEDLLKYESLWAAGGRPPTVLSLRALTFSMLPMVN